MQLFEAIEKINEEIFSNEESYYTKPFIKCMVHYSNGVDVSIAFIISKYTVYYIQVNIATVPENGELDFTEVFTGIDQTAGRAGRSIFRSVEFRSGQGKFSVHFCRHIYPRLFNE